ncbi:ankyrin repeat-containing domain protein, partial [Trichophaea hybrida]
MPFIGYSLEFLKQKGGEVDTQKPLSDLTASLQSCPSSAAFCLLKRLVNSNEDPNNVQRQVNHLLRVAAEEGCAAAVSNLLAAGASYESVDKRKCTPLHTTTEMGHEATVRLLLDRGAYKEARDHRGYTALHWAAQNGNTATVEFLVGRGADKEATDRSERTALHLAVGNGHGDTVQLLLDQGAD